mgnify:CR=1 FL=1
MYKNFNLTKEEREQILEQHSSYGYRKPLNESPSAMAAAALAKAKSGQGSKSIAAEITTRDKTMAATIFGEVIKNLEISKC